jgi:hypothetical protein
MNGHEIVAIRTVAEVIGKFRIGEFGTMRLLMHT